MTDSSRPGPRVSVCMATYRGARFVEEQLTSILEQLGPDDEVVIIDDASPDSTVDAINGITDPRIRLERATTNRGYVRTFEAALRSARGEFLLLSDQDDVWLPGRVDAMTRSLEAHAVVATNLTMLGGPDSLRGPLGQADWRLRPEDSRRAARNVLGVLAGNRPYYGCAMGVRRDALAVLLPFPGYLTESHDLWIALYGNLSGSIEHLPIRSLARRVHGENQTPDRPRGIVPVLRARVMLARAVGTLRRRIASSSPR